MENNSFKRVTFGGFAKQDVIDYIEKTARENAAVVEQLRKENASLQDELKEVKLQLEGALAYPDGKIAPDGPKEGLCRGKDGILPDFRKETGKILWKQ